MPFRDEAERDAWATAHEATGHTVSYAGDPPYPAEQPIGSARPEPGENALIVEQLPALGGPLHGEWFDAHSPGFFVPGSTRAREAELLDDLDLRETVDVGMVPKYDYARAQLFVADVEDAELVTVMTVFLWLDDPAEAVEWLGGLYAVFLAMTDRQRLRA